MASLIFRRLKHTHKSALSEIYFGVNTLNRHSFLRSDSQFIANSITSPYSKFVFFDNLSPIANIEQGKLFTLNYNTIGLENRYLIDDWIKNNELRTTQMNQSPLIHFLGLDTSKFTPFKYNQYSGVPYYAIEISKHPSLAQRLSKYENLKPLITREDVNKVLDYKESTIFSHGKIYLEWLSTTKYCKGCGSQTIPINAGSELKCSNTESCPVKDSPVSNASFPRLDPALITCVLNPTKDKVLFTRMSKFPAKMYTHIAGFMEPGETLEESVKREVWEEAGLIVDELHIVRSQPWPYPANIMIGCVAIVKDGNIDLNHDIELDEAVWVPLTKLKEIISKGKEDENLTIIIKGEDKGIPNDKTLATKLFQYVAQNY
ncbi:hypothetical protein WICPIJ_007174 [Wickerhamomyces pijperi]|uniref:NAD(+) diphosphatase n=1 Tax=Wickerhamomyces pijperi TaxID=599730 RepID=A0A9P8Q0E9_WICPI|nr:hypothetical protein WICPIJ_007174 [Wickerhamomyces pijperi]